MDTIYLAVKNLLKSLVNLIAAVLELFSNVINWIASCLRNFYPHISGKYAQISHNRKKGTGLLERKKSKKPAKGEEELTEEIRNQLREKVAGKEQYYAVYFRLSEDGNGFLANILLAAALILAGCGVASGGSHTREFRFLLVMIMALVCMAAGLIIHWHQKKIMKIRLARHLLETEFRDKLWENPGQADTTEIMQEKGEAGTMETMHEKGGTGMAKVIHEKGRAGIISMMQEKNKEQTQIPAEESVK